MHAKFLLPFLVASALAAPVFNPATAPEGSLEARSYGKQDPPKSVYNPTGKRVKGGKRDLEARSRGKQDPPKSVYNPHNVIKGKGKGKRDLERDESTEE
ncbi:hypothetical protein MAPG_02793 [Magnaporthiopsis poae ATCC 64411]|uniref:Uncharacterized protein n=1 Tax=Magnaporthiopsis poae (strain ATCC 64411 / 73-15) TaxID=644358 RepID=A0A0C4DSB5_MAGP6|nr:hypothetical protein MAPG_02793 [Magnaporthiopsis poae ATCC 64411]